MVLWLLPVFKLNDRKLASNLKNEKSAAFLKEEIFSPKFKRTAPSDTPTQAARALKPIETLNKMV